MDPEIVEMVRFLDPETAAFLEFLDQEIVKMDKKNLDPETVEMVRFLDPEIVEKVDKSFMTCRGTNSIVPNQILAVIILLHPLYPGYALLHIIVMSDCRHSTMVMVSQAS